MAAAQQTEKATPHRLKKAREKGEFPATRDFVAGIQFLGVVLAGASLFPGWMAAVEDALRAGLRRPFVTGHGEFRAGDLVALLRNDASKVLMPLGVAAALLLGLTLAAQMAATGMGFSMARLSPSLSRLNPGPKLRDLPANNLVHLGQAAVLLPLICQLAWTLVRNRLPDLLSLPYLSLQPAAETIGRLMSDTLRRAAIVLVVIGAVMLLRERARYNRRLRMSKQEVREELKETDGNPHTKARIRRIQRDLRRRNMMKDVPAATAVIVNPTHYAVALRYEQGSMSAPKVVAKGRNYLAARIRHHAISNQVPIIENPPLAQALYKAVEVGQEIPAHLYRAVAEILAYIFRVMGKGPVATEGGRR